MGREVFSLLTAVLVVASISFAIANGSQTAQVVTAAGNAFGGLVKSATLQA